MKPFGKDPRDEHLALRPAVAGDVAMVFAWRNLPSIVAAAAHKGTISWAGHERWFAESLRGEARQILIIECDGAPAGQIRVDWTAPDEAEVSLYLLPDFTGRGLGVKAIQLGCQRMAKATGLVRMVAWVRDDNAPSQSAFRKAGFIARGSGEVRPGLGCVEFLQVAPVPHNRLTFGSEEEQAAVRVVRSGGWAGGSELLALEREMARVAGVAHAVAVGTGVGALRLSLLALGVGPGDAVAVPAYSCVALANAVLACGADPVPVDVEPGTWNMAVPALREILIGNPAIKAGVAVHTFGCPAPVAELEALGVPVVEDCSHGFGVAPLGRLGRIAMLSLFATKLIGAGEGGVILTADDTLAARIRSARDYTDQAPSAGRLNDKMTDLEAALARCQLERLPRLLARRAEWARRYTDLLAPQADEGGYFLPEERPRRVWYRYVVAVNDAHAVAAQMAAQGVTAQRPIENWCPAVEAPVSVTARQCNLSLPLYPTLTEGEQDRVVAAFLAAVGSRIPA